MTRTPTTEIPEKTGLWTPALPQRSTPRPRLTDKSLMITRMGVADDEDSDGEEDEDTLWSDDEDEDEDEDDFEDDNTALDTEPPLPAPPSVARRGQCSLAGLHWSCWALLDSIRNAPLAGAGR